MIDFSDPELVHVGQNLFVAPRDVCHRQGPQFSKVLHIWRDDYPSHSCDTSRSKAARASDLLIQYHDQESLPRPLIHQVAEFLKGEDPVLIHCAAGQTRSSTLALIGKLVRGSNPRSALGEIVDEIWKKRRIAANIFFVPLRDILEWYHER